MNEVLNTIKSRRSIRNYAMRQISQVELDAIIEAGIYAPTAVNEQPWHFTIIQNADLLKKINATAKKFMLASDIEWVRKTAANPEFEVTYNAPTLIIVSGRQNAVAWSVDCAAAIQNMLIAAESLNIGSVWLGLLRYFLQQEDDIRELKIPAGYRPFYGVAFGYKVEGDETVAPNRNLDVVTYIR